MVLTELRVLRGGKMLISFFRYITISVGKEVDIGLGGGRDKSLRTADMLLYSWDRGLDGCVDLTGSSPLTQTRMVDFVSGHAVEGGTNPYVQLICCSTRGTGLDVCVDLTGSSPLTQTGMINFVLGRAVIEVIVSSGLAFDSALNAFNVKMEIDLLSNSSEIAAPKLMKKLADIYFTSVTQMAESTFSLSTRQMALWKVSNGGHTTDWLSVGSDLLLAPESLWGIFKGTCGCPCAGIVGIKHRHNVVRDTLVDICYRSGISSGKEVNIGLDGEHDKSLRPADVLLYSWDVGRDVCVDLTGSSPLTQTGMVDFVPGRAVTEAAQRKRVKYEAKCADIGYGFLPFSFSSFGELEKDAVTLLKRIRKFSMAQDMGARAAVYIFNNISFSIAKGSKCVDIGYGFLPSFSSIEELEKDAVTLLKRIRKFFMTQDIGARIAAHIFSRIRFVVARVVGAKIVSRLPTNFLRLTSSGLMARVRGFLFLNIDKLKLFLACGDPRVSLDADFCQDLTLKRVSKTISLMGAIHKLHDPQFQFDKALRNSLEKIVFASGPGFGDWQWRLATLPFYLGGLGILSVGDLIWLTIPMFSEESVCPSCNVHRMDKWGDHAVHYSSNVGVKFRHNLVCDILVDICSKVGIMVRKEAPMGFRSGDGKDLRPADLLLFNWLQGKDACLDVTGISPFAGMGAKSGPSVSC
ncbi:hypothetical protein Tco_1284453 [Tanacetum coccineum]